MLRCRADERNVTSEMLRTLQTNKLNINRADLTNHLLGLLEDKYDTKKWIVVVLNEIVKDDRIEHLKSAGFHTAAANGLFALAISVATPEDSPELYRLKSRTFDNYFKFPFANKRDSVFEISQYLSRYLTPLRTSDVETLVVRTPCASSELEMMQSFVTVKSSAGLGKTYLTNDGTCVSYLAIVAIPSSNSNINSECRYQDTSNVPSTNLGGLLRNEVTQSYLTLKDDSSKSYVILEERRMGHESNAQRWRFVNFTLRSDIGKCLTVVKGEKSHVRAEYCSTPLDETQKWMRHGLQIVNGFNKCLSLNHEKGIVQSQCDYRPSYLWYDWDVDCEDAGMSTYLPMANDNSYRPLRNEFSRRYLSLNEGGWVTHQPWSNQSDQYWRFIDGQLLNKKNGKCLMAHNSNYFRLDDCAESGNDHQWNYHNKQIADISGAKCLSIPDDGTSTKIEHSQCKDDPVHHWR